MEQEDSLAIREGVEERLRNKRGALVAAAMLLGASTNRVAVDGKPSESRGSVRSTPYRQMYPVGAGVKVRRAKRKARNQARAANRRRS